jgi:hypothetical protein
MGGTAGSDFQGTGPPTSRANLASQSSDAEMLSNRERQYSENAVGASQQARSTSPQTGYGYPANADQYDPAYTSRPMGGSNSYSPVSPQESYRPYGRLSISTDHELGNLDSAAASQFHQIPSHYSFSGVPRTSPIEAPQREMTPAQELAAARLRSNISPAGLKGIDD